MNIENPKVWTLYTNRGQPIEISFVDIAVMKITWSLDRRGYPVGKVRGKKCYLHKVIAERMKMPSGYYVDHIDGNKQNNRRDNLRAATPAQSSRHRGQRRDARSKYKGVRPSNGAWKAYFRGLCLGLFLKEEDAAIAYDFAAIREYGEFAWPSFPDDVRELRSQ